MKRIRFAVTGSGWRSLFYLRIARALPEIFSVSAVRVRSEEKRELIRREYGLNAVLTDEELIQTGPDFVVVAVSKGDLFSVSKSYLELGVPVLCETPGAFGEEELRAALEYRPKVQYVIAEQYFLYPEYSALIRLLENGIIGRPTGLYLSICHDYHAVSLMRRLLLKSGHPRLLYSHDSEEMAPGGFSRYSSAPDGSTQATSRRVAVYRFESGEEVLYDFSSIQYHSPLRSSSCRITGEKGEIRDGLVRYYDDSLKVREGYIRREKEHISFEGVTLFESSFKGRGLSSDEYAIAALLLNFSRALKGEEQLLYPAREALLDTLSALGAELGKEA